MASTMPWMTVMLAAAAAFRNACCQAVLKTYVHDVLADVVGSLLQPQHDGHSMAVTLRERMHVWPCCFSTAAACPAGTFSTGSETCADCPKGSFCEGGIFSLSSPPVNESCPVFMTTMGSRSRSSRACGKLAWPAWLLQLIAAIHSVGATEARISGRWQAEAVWI